jgi:beta-N-acetylhexosaminidase
MFQSKSHIRFACFFSVAILGIVCADAHTVVGEIKSPAPLASSLGSGAFPSLSPGDEALLKAMPLRTKVGQLLLVGYPGSALHPGLDTLVSRLHPGALIVFGRNITSATQISLLNSAAQNISLKNTKLPLMIAVDQEGGDVIRIKTHFPLPSALALGQTSDLHLVERAGHATGKLLKALGFNMNLAPVLDVGDPNEVRFIGTRTFGHDAKLVGQMATHFSTGLEGEGVLPTAKHFPGHGGVEEDSHLSMPEKKSSAAELWQHDIVPFKMMADSFPHPWAVMLAHVVYPALDPSRMPATFSKPIIGGILRKNLGFRGLVVTDDIQMAGALVVGDIRERAIRAIDAGADLIMIGWNRKVQFQVANALYRAVKSGRLSESRINDSVRKMIAAKRLYAKNSAATTSSAALRLALQNPEFETIAANTLNAALTPITSQSADADSLSAIHQSNSVFIFSANSAFMSSFRNSVIEKKTRLFAIGSSWNLDIDHIMRSNPLASGVFYISGVRAARLASHISADVAKRILVVTVEPQSMITNAENFAHVSDVYYRHPELGKFVAEKFFNQSPVALRQPASKSQPIDR